MEQERYEPIIGFEIHVELATKSKMFCGCKNDPFFAQKPNIYTCPVCLGLPGALPVPNRKAVEWTIMLGLALGCEIPELSKFDRKHYFYPDLPKGYQISQYDQPLAINGWLELANNPINKLSNDEKKTKIRIRRVHLEEDTAKLMHATIEGPTSPSGLGGAGKKVSLIDFNRSGVPLVEIVTEPDIRSVEDAKIFLKKIHQIVRYLDISDADMEKGSMRLEPNISVRKVGSKALPEYKVEVKNINSFRFAARAIEYEIARQTDILKAGKTPVQENRGWNEGKGATVPQRGKEEAEDYRYFPEPDIPPMRFTALQISELRTQIPELPDAKRNRLMRTYGLSEYDANLLTEARALADYFEEAVRVGKTVSAKHIANWLINRSIDIDTTLPAKLIAQMGAAKQTVALDEKIIEGVLAENSKAVEDYKKGKEQALMFLVGAVMRRTKGNAEEVRKKIKELIHG